LINDLATIDKLTEVKTEIGLARAFVRLSLEKKMLGEHLRQLLNKGDLLRYMKFLNG
jgi:DENN domain-containing protein 5